MDQLTLRQVGTVRSPVTDLATAPRQPDEGGVTAIVEIRPEFEDAMAGLVAGQDLLLFTWLHAAERDRLVTHPRRDPTKALAGVFSVRSPHRPNPIGLHRVRILAINRRDITVAPLEVVDGTPIIDLKPVLDREYLPALPQGGYGAAQADILAAGRRAWDRGLLSGFNSNLSIRLPGPDSSSGGDVVLVTGTGCQKGRLSPEHLALLDLGSGALRSGPRCSTEAPMHLAVYRAVPEAKAIVHVHPPHLLAASLRFGPQKMLDLPLYEADVFANMLTVAPAIAPGTDELAQAVAQAATGHRAVLMANHGLVCHGPDVWDALGLAEELESLARIRLLAECGTTA